MELENRHIELIDKYLNKELSSDEIIEVESLINSDPEFSKEVELHKVFLHGITELGELEIKKILHLEHKKHLVKDKRYQARVKKVFLIAASGLFCLVLGVIAILNPKNTAEERRAKHLAKPISYKEKFHLNDDGTSRIDSSIVTEHLEERSQTNINTVPVIYDSIVATLKYDIKSFAPILHPHYTWHNDTINLYGLELSENALIFKFKNSEYLFSDQKYYGIKETNSSLPLINDHPRVTDSHINADKFEEIWVVQHLFERTPNEQKIKLQLTDQLKGDSLYIFHDNTLTIGEINFKSLFHENVEFLYFNDHVFIDHLHHLYTLEDGDNLKLTEKNIDNDIKFILSPSITKVNRVTETVEDLLEGYSN